MELPETQAEPGSNRPQVIADQGSGRAFLLIIDTDRYRKMAETLHASLANSCRSVLIHIPPVSDHNWEDQTNMLLEAISALGIRQVSFVAFGAGGAVVKNLALREPKMVRTIALVDATARPHPTWLSRSIDSLEHFLPLGLPLRSPKHGFDSRATLHRLRNPILSVVTSGAGTFLKHQGMLVSREAPTAWYVDLSETAQSGGDETAILSDLVLNFQDIPVKCPQKNRAP